MIEEEDVGVIIFKVIEEEDVGVINEKWHRKWYWREKGKSEMNRIEDWSGLYKWAGEVRDWKKEKKWEKK